MKLIVFDKLLVRVFSHLKFLEKQFKLNLCDEYPYIIGLLH